jgi:hypothetical protein
MMPLLIADARPGLTKSLILLEPTGPPFQEAVFSSTPARKWGLTDIPIAYSPPVTDPTTELVNEVVQPANPSTNNATVSCVLQARNSTSTSRQLSNLVPLPILLLTSEASYHAPYDYCTVAFLKQAGYSKTKHLELPKVGIHGNGHMMFMEKNSDEIWDRVYRWIMAVS